MKYMYGTFLGILVCAGLALTIYFGLQPKPVPKIKTSFLTEPERLGEAIAQRLWQELRPATIVFLGVEPGNRDHLKVWKGFLDSLPPEQKFSQVVIDPMLPEKSIISFTEEIDLQKETDRFKEGLKIALKNNIRVAVIVPSIYSSQSIPDNPIYRLKVETQFLPMSLSIAQPSLTREEEADVLYPCTTGSGDNIGLGSWGCLIQTKSRSLYRKKMQPGKYLGVMDLIGESDYLVLFREIPKS